MNKMQHEFVILLVLPLFIQCLQTTTFVYLFLSVPIPFFKTFFKLFAKYMLLFLKQWSVNE
jgi:hypothetical protein